MGKKASRQIKNVDSSFFGNANGDVVFVCVRGGSRDFAKSFDGFRSAVIRFIRMWMSGDILFLSSLPSLYLRAFCAFISFSSFGPFFFLLVFLSFF